MTSTLHAIFIALALGIFGCSTAIADTGIASEKTESIELVRPAHRACLKNAGGRIQQAVCTKEEQTYQSQQLEHAYNKLFSLISEDQRLMLEKSQADWKLFVDSELRLSVALLDPMQMDMQVSENEILLTAQRRFMLNQTAGLIDMNNDGKID